MEEPWTILELAERAADALTATPQTGTPADAGTSSAEARANGRVRDVPNERLVRWYVTVGLVDPPLSRRGRVARYGRRHLLQLVAVKRRQAEGRSLAEIQAELAGVTDEALASVARLTDASPAPQAAPAAPDRFWARQPREPGLATPDAERPDQAGPIAAERPCHTPAVAAARPDRTGSVVAGRARAVAAGRRDRTGSVGAGRPDRRGSAAAGRGGASARVAAQGGGTDRGAAGPATGLVYGVRLAPGVTLLLEGADREPGPDDLTDIANAAEPLLRELASRGFRVFGPGHPGQPPEAGPLAEGARHDH